MTFGTLLSSQGTDASFGPVSPGPPGASFVIHSIRAFQLRFPVVLSSHFPPPSGGGGRGNSENVTGPGRPSQIGCRAPSGTVRAGQELVGKPRLMPPWLGSSQRWVTALPRVKNWTPSAP
ncbi:hypothetical protein DN069_16365 [Streptacidiphilus pinicola]|uniref:Uncharacterized protein n=1 Tax=Streptacidiphilus pinicola TaxID=2219663 RepID=A0A2X0J2W0_9ACTN|nr:hypothetical protein DN069_16365 [Streptacidiphilus pinicola]